MDKNFEIRRLKKGDEEGLSQLFWKVFKKKKTSQYWYWKYYQNPAGKHMNMVAVNGDKIVGLIGAIPIKIKARSKVLQTSQFTDIAILPEYRNIKTFMQMAQLSKEECLKSDFHINYGFSNMDTHLFSTKFLDFKGVCSVLNMTKVINPTPYLQNKIRVTSWASKTRRSGSRCRCPPGRIFLSSRSSS